MTPLLALLLLAQTQTHSPAWGGEPSAPDVASSERGWHSLLRLEASALGLLPTGVGGALESYAQVTPMLVVDGGGSFGFNLGAPVRLRLGDGELGVGQIRREDWDSLSDWGQLLHALKLGSDDSPVGLWVGALESYTLHSGHLVRRYSNRLNPDYHPAGASLTVSLGPLYTEAFASDVLGARLLGAQVDVDLEHLLAGPPGQPGRYTLGLSAVEDFGRVGEEASGGLLAHVDGTAVLVVLPGFELHLLAGWGTRPGVSGAWGAVAGVGADARTRTLEMTLRLEARRQRGGFRQGYFGPDYELGRWVAVGPSGLPLAQAPFPDGASAYAEARVGWDGALLDGLLQRHLSLSLGVEMFDWGRVDVDGCLALQLAERSVEVALSGLALGLGQPGARHLYSGQVRWRFAGRLYMLAQGGTLLFPTADGALRPGAYASLGLGVDHVH